MKCLRTIVRSHPIDLRHNESKLGQWLDRSAKSLWYERTLRSGVDRLNHRIFFRRIEIRRAVDNTPDISLAVSADSGKDFRRTPTRREQRLDVALLKLQDYFPIFCQPQLRDRW